MTQSLITESIRRIDRMARRDPGQRGFSTGASVDHLNRAAEHLLSAERVILVTGFCIRAAMIGENDGPPGTLALAAALRQLGKNVHLVSDRHSTGLLAAGSAPYGAPFKTLELSLDQEKADQQIQTLLASFAPTHVVAIERPGNALDGHRYSMRGETLDDLSPSADRLLQPDAPRSYRTLAIGDGGNELGMGSLRQELMGRIQHGELIFCATPADDVIPAGISNWGAYALVAALSLQTGQLLLQTPEHERKVLEAMLAAGAVDGCTRQPELSVDGIAWAEYAATLSDIYAETRRTLQR